MLSWLSLWAIKRSSLAAPQYARLLLVKATSRTAITYRRPTLLFHRGPSAPGWVVDPKEQGLGRFALPTGPAPPFSHVVETPPPLSATQWKTVDMMPAYPGQHSSRPSLQVSERMGPTIMTDFLLHGRDLETHVRGVMGNWKTVSKSFSPSAHAEAVTLTRALHLLVLEAGCPRVALRRSVVPEVLLRRLFCLLEVERQVAQTQVTRARAWQTVDSVLEHRAEA